MNWFVKLISHPGRRCGIGFLMILVFGPLAGFFPPFVVLVLLGVLFFLTLGEDQKILWFETSKEEECEHCKAVCNVKAVRVKHCMQVFFPFPILVKLFSMIKIPYRTTYHTVCAQCLDKHVGNCDFAAINTVANGGMATVKEITKEEFEALLPKNK